MAIHVVSSLQSRVDEDTTSSNNSVARIVVTRACRVWRMKGVSLARRLDDGELLRKRRWWKRALKKAPIGSNMTKMEVTGDIGRERDVLCR